MKNIGPEIQNYISILEKTNQQLSLWYNPYGILVAILTILFTILTIVAVIIIYRQSKDYKNKLKADRDFYRKKIKDFLDSQKKIIEQRNETAEEISQKIDKIVGGYKEKLKKSSEEQKKSIQEAIDKLEMEKLILKKDVGPITVTPNFDYSLGSVIDLSNKKFHRCSKCGFGFYIKDNFPQTCVSAYNFCNTVTCPKCGNIDNID